MIMMTNTTTAEITDDNDDNYDKNYDVEGNERSEFVLPLELLFLSL